MNFVPEVGSEVMEPVPELELVLVFFFFLDTVPVSLDELVVVELSLLPPDTLVEPDPELAVADDSLAELLAWRVTITPTMTPMTARITTIPVSCAFLVSMVTPRVLPCCCWVGPIKPTGALMPLLHSKSANEETECPDATALDRGRSINATEHRRLPIRSLVLVFWLSD